MEWRINNSIRSRVEVRRRKMNGNKKKVSIKKHFYFSPLRIINTISTFYYSLFFFILYRLIYVLRFKCKQHNGKHSKIAQSLYSTFCVCFPLFLSPSMVNYGMMLFMVEWIYYYWEIEILLEWERESWFIMLTSFWIFDYT